MQERAEQDAGAVVEFAFGSENYFGGGIREATDAQRIDRRRGKAVSTAGF